MLTIISLKRFSNLQNNKTRIAAVLSCYFALGYADIAGTVANCVGEEFGLNNFVTSLVPGLFFLWYLILPLPIAGAMNRFGRVKVTVAALTACSIGLASSYFSYSAAAIVFSLGMIGIGVTGLMTTLNPLVSSIVPEESTASVFSLGQIFKTMASISTPLLAAIGIRLSAGTEGWRLIFPIFLVITVVLTALIAFVPETKPDKGGSLNLKDCFTGDKAPVILISLAAIFFAVGLDVEFTVTVPQIYMERLGLRIDESVNFNAVYFASRLFSTIMAVWLLRSRWTRYCLPAGIIVMAVALLLTFTASSSATLTTGVVMMGLGIANICTIVIAEAFHFFPQGTNKISALMILGLSGGAVLPAIAGAFPNGPEVVSFVAVAVLAVYFLIIRKTRVRA